MTRERWLSALARNTVLAAVLGGVVYFAVPRASGGWWAYVDAFTMAFCFTFLGHVIEVLLLLVPGIEVGIGRLVRLAGWFGGGLWIYVIGRWLWLMYGHDVQGLPALPWGGAFFVGLELVVHALLRARGKPNFYTGGQVAA